MNRAEAIFKRNLQTLAHRYPDLARAMVSTLPADAELIQTRVGVPSIRLKNAGGRPYTLHSTVDPLT